MQYLEPFLKLAGLPKFLKGKLRNIKGGDEIPKVKGGTYSRDSYVKAKLENHLYGKQNAKTVAEARKTIGPNTSPAEAKKIREAREAIDRGLIPSLIKTAGYWANLTGKAAKTAKETAETAGKALEGPAKTRWAAAQAVKDAKPPPGRNPWFGGKGKELKAAKEELKSTEDTYIKALKSKKDADAALAAAVTARKKTRGWTAAGVGAGIAGVAGLSALKKKRNDSTYED